MKSKALVTLVSACVLTALGGCHSSEPLVPAYRSPTDTPKKKNDMPSVPLPELDFRSPPALEQKKSTLEGFAVEATIYDAPPWASATSRGKPSGYSVRVSDDTGARIEAYGSTLETLRIVRISPRWTVYPAGHPFEKYDGEKMRELYKLVMNPAEKKD